MVPSVLAVAPLFVLIVRWLSAPGPYYLIGDQAILDLRVRQAVRFQQLLGPFDRFGWHHPGPLYFYLLAVPGWLLGPGWRPDFVGTALIEAGSCLAVVWALRRRFGPLGAIWAAACLGALSLALAARTPGVLVTFWNPLAVIFPLALVVVLCAGGAAGSLPSLVGAAIAGSFVVQTNVSTVPLVVGLLIGASAAALWRPAAGG